MKKETTIFVNTSGGETSWYMAYLAKKYWSTKYNLVFVFANTGKEREETYVFNNQCSEYFDIQLNWVEAVINPQKGIGTKHKIVDFGKADRSGKVFESMISKYGIPNVATPKCSSVMKSDTIYSFIKEYMQGNQNYKIAIGIRSDEFDRINKDREKLHLIYPLISTFPSTKRTINKFWDSMPFRLQLKGYEGNCDYCFKKSLRKLLTLVVEDNSDRLSWWETMEKKYEIHPVNPKITQRFFRNNMSIDELRKRAKLPFQKAIDDKQNTKTGFFDDLDVSGSCSESCEPF